MILLDTHVALWLSADPSRLSRNARTAIEEARRTGEVLAICDISLLELATLAGKGRLTMTVPLESVFQQIEARFNVLPITSLTAARTQTLPAAYPKDPADRIIGATALVEGIVLLTADRAIRRSKAVHTIW